LAVRKSTRPKILVSEGFSSLRLLCLPEVNRIPKLDVTGSIPVARFVVLLFNAQKWNGALEGSWWRSSDGMGCGLLWRNCGGRGGRELLPEVGKNRPDLLPAHRGTT